MTYTWFGFRFSVPEMWIRQGLTLAMTRPSLRNQRPVRWRRGSTSKSLIGPSSGTQSTIRAAVAAQIHADRRKRVILKYAADADRRKRVILKYAAVQILALSTTGSNSSLLGSNITRRSEERRVGKECRSRWSP